MLWNPAALPGKLRKLRSQTGMVTAPHIRCWPALSSHTTTLFQAELFGGGWHHVDSKSEKSPILSTVCPGKPHLHCVIMDLKGKEEKKYIARNKTQTKGEKKKLQEEHSQGKGGGSEADGGAGPEETPEASFGPLWTPALHSRPAHPVRTKTGFRVGSVQPTQGLEHSRRSVNICEMDERSSKKKFP